MAMDAPAPGAGLIGKRVNVLDKGWVELQDLMGNDLAIVNAARASFLGESKGGDRDKKLLFYLMEHRHTSPFEQVEFKFRVRAPVVTWWQWVRHRTWNFNAQSGRYVAFEENDFYMPAVWRRQSPSNKQASLGELSEAEAQPLFDALAEHYARGYALYKQALEAGVARELARLQERQAETLYRTGEKDFSFLLNARLARLKAEMEEVKATLGADLAALALRHLSGELVYQYVHEDQFKKAI